MFFGAILLDLVYFNYLSAQVNTPALKALFTVGSDLLLYFGILVIIAASGALALSWSLKIARNLVFASFLLLIFEFIAPIIFNLFIRDPQNIWFGPWLRIILSGSASFLAFTGAYTFFHQK